MTGADSQHPSDSDLPVRAALGPIPDEAFDRIAALVRKVLGVPVGLVSLVDRDGQVFPGQAGLPQPWSETRCTPLTHSFCQHVVRNGQPLIIADARRDPLLRTNLAIVDIGVVAYAGIPLFDLDDDVIGSLCAIDTEPRDWTSDEIGLLTDLAATCSAELKLRTAARVAREAQIRTSALLDLSETLSNTLTAADISQAVGKLAVSRLDGSFGGITVLDEAAGRLNYVDLDALPEGLQSRYQSIPLSRSMPSTDVVRTGQALYFTDLESMRARYPEAGEALATTGGRAAAYVPLRVGDRVVGTVAILWSRERDFTEADRALLAGLSSYTAQAVGRALLLADRREVAETLQAAMMPVLPAVDFVSLDGRYYPARVGDAVGGDWYDAFELPDRSLGISVGDVAGHDTAAAAVMGQMRAMLTCLAIATPGSPAQSLSALDRVLASQPLGRYATGILATLTQHHDRTTTLHWSNAGHLPPLLLNPGSAPTYLERAAELMLGIPATAPTRSAHTTVLQPGATLLMFTDGLIERRQVDLQASLDNLAVCADRHRDLPISAMIDAVLADTLEHPEDDVVLLGVRIPQ